MGPKETGLLYIAISEGLNEWAQDAGYLYLFKIGTAQVLADRLNSLNNGFRGEPNSRPLLGYSDWEFAESWCYHSRIDANNNEKPLKEFLKSRYPFDYKVCPTHNPLRKDGATEVYLVREDELSGLDEALSGQNSGRNNRVDRQVLKAIARTLRVEVERLFPATAPPDEDKDDFNSSQDSASEPDDATLEDDDTDREFDVIIENMLNDQDDYGRSHEDGWFYPDKG